MTLNVGGQAVVNGVVLKVDSPTTMAFDRNNAIYRNATVVLTETSTDGLPALVPIKAGDLLAPFGNELQLSYGIKFDDGTTEQIPVITGGIETTLIDDTGPDLALTLSVFDRARSYQRAGFTDVLVIPPFTAIEGAIMQILSSIQVGFTPLFNFVATGFTTGSSPSVYVPGDDPWQSCWKLASDAGFALRHDPLGTGLLLPIPNPYTQPISWRYDEGANLAVGIKRTLTRNGVSNWVIRDGQGTGVVPPVRGIAQDTNPRSRTYIGGPFGVQVDYATSAVPSSQGMAQNAAQAAFFTGLGSVETLEMTAIPKPDHEADDVIEVTRVRAGIPPGTLFVLDAGTLGFGGAGIFDVTCRAIADMTGPTAG